MARTLRPAAKGIISIAYLKDPSGPTWKEDAEVREGTAFMNKYLPQGDKSDTGTVYAYAVAQTLVQVLKQCGDDLTHANVMKQAANLKDLKLGMLLPGIAINTSASGFFPIEQMRFQADRLSAHGYREASVPAGRHPPTDTRGRRREA